MESALDFDAPFKSFQKRLRTFELHTPELDNRNRQLFGLPSQMVVREAFVGDPTVIGVSEAECVKRQSRRVQG